MPVKTIIILVLIFSVILSIVESLVSKHKVRVFVMNFVILVVIMAFFFLKGPLFIFSPIKIGYSTFQESNLTIYYPKDIDGALLDETRNVISFAREEVLSLYGEDVEEKYVLIDSTQDMLYLAGVPVEEAKGSSNSEAVYLKVGDADLGIITHELSHYYLQKSSGKYSFFFPRWFDEGLATYLNGTGSLEKFTKYSTLVESIESGKYQEDLTYWDGVNGMYRWLFKDCKTRPIEVYTQSYFLVKYLSEEYGDDLVSKLVKKSSEYKNFDELFEDVYGISIDEFHESFLKGHTRYEELSGV